MSHTETTPKPDPAAPGNPATQEHEVHGTTGTSRLGDEQPLADGTTGTGGPVFDEPGAAHSCTDEPHTGEHGLGASSHTPQDADPDTTPAAGKSGARRALAIAGALLLACGGLVTYGILATDDPKPPPVPTAKVTYEVQGKGKADITYRDRSTTTATAVRLPWKKTVRLPLGQSPIVSITLGQKGGKATCSLALRGRHVQSATAFGPFGRANCTATLPAPQTGPGATHTPP